MGLNLKTFNDVLEIRSGRNQKEVLDENGEYPIIGSAGKVMGYANNYICVENTTIIGRKGTINSPMMIKEKFWNVDTAFGLHAKEELDKKYLFYFCQNFDFTKLDRGSGRPSLVKSDLLKIKIPLPKTLEKQKQIVDILDKAFEAIDKAKENLEKNIQNSKELFQSRLNEIFSQKGESWEEKDLIEISKIMYGYTAKSKDSGNTKYLRITDIQDNYVDWDSVPYCDLEENEFSKYKLQKGDIVFARTGATTGKSYLIEDSPKSVFASYLIRVQLYEEHLLPSFLYLFFQSSYYWNEINKGMSGSAQGGFNAKKLGALKISYPKEEKIQLNIIKELSILDKQTKQLETNYQQKLQNLEELKKSILQKAFSGELI